MIARNYAKDISLDDFCKPWSEHDIEFDIDRIKSRGFVTGEQKEFNGIKGYNFFRSDSNVCFFKLETLLAMNYARKIVSSTVPDIGFDSPWPEHGIEFDNDVIKARGFIGVKQDTMNGIKGYRFIKSDGNSQFIRIEMVLIQKLAKKL